MTGNPDLTRTEQVLGMAARGWRLFPVMPREKQPLVADWPHQATSDEAQLRFWLRRFADCNWGVATGPASGIFVLDVDGQQGQQSLRDLEGKGYVLSNTLKVRTGRGEHIYFEWPPNGTVIRNSAGKLAPRLDIRGVGGYVIVPPSIHPNGTAYKCVDEEAPIAPAPEWLLGMLIQPSTAPEPNPATVQPHSEAIPEGQRNTMLMSLAGTMRQRGMTQGAIEAALLAENKKRCVPPLPEQEVRAIAKSASRYDSASSKGSVALRTGSRGWPAPLGPEAFQGLVGEFVQLVRPETEADDAALLFSYLVTLGSIIGRGPYYQVGGDRHYTNLFAVIVGDTAKARKGTSWGEVRRFVGLVDEKWCTSRVAGGLSSGEGLIHAVRDPDLEAGDDGVKDKRLLAVESELSQALQSAKREGNTLSAIIRQAWDGSTLRVLAKNAKAVCLEPHISILAHITVAELQRQLTTNDMANGFANRFLWICAARSKCLPFGGAVNQEILKDVAVRTREAIDFARTIGRVEFALEARLEWELVYPRLSDGRLGLLGEITARAEAQTVRIAMLYAILDRSAEIKPVHLHAALAAWRYCDESARFIFGDSLGDPTADEILSLLRGSQEGVTRSELNDHFKRNKSSAEIGRALAVLQSHGLARAEQQVTGGRPAGVWKAIVPTNGSPEITK
jgi:hypothetical protein